MKNKIVLVLLLAYSCYNCESQSKKIELSDGFAAFIVKDIKTSIDWYTSKLGFEIINETSLEERGIKQANLKLGNTKIELIESNSSINPRENNDNKKLVQGIFKVGFIVSNFDNWVDRFFKFQLITKNDIVINSTDNKRMLIIKDPDGNRIQLFEK